MKGSRPSTSVGSDAASHIYILDLPASRVVVFDQAGQHLRTVGRPGQGPGEFSSGNSLAVAPDGSIAVFDFAKAALVQFDGEGEVLPEKPLPLFPSVGGGSHLGWTSAGLLVGSMVTPVEENTFRQVLQLLGESENVILAEISSARPGMVWYPSCGGGLTLPRIFEPQIIWGLSGNTIAVSRSPSYEIEILDGIRPVRKIKRDIELRVATEADARAELGDGFRINFGNGPCTIPPQAMVPARGFSEHVPWIEQVAPSPTGEVWVRRAEVGSGIEGPIDIFDSSGAYLGTLPPDTPYPLLFVNEDVFGAAEKDETDVERLVLYRIRRG